MRGGFCSTNSSETLNLNRYSLPGGGMGLMIWSSRRPTRLWHLSFMPTLGSPGGGMGLMCGERTSIFSPQAINDMLDLVPPDQCEVRRRRETCESWDDETLFLRINVKFEGGKVYTVCWRCSMARESEDASEVWFQTGCKGLGLICGADCNTLVAILLFLVDFNMFGVFYMKMLIYVNISVLLIDIYFII